jgi:hypothetical protein
MKRALALTDRQLALVRHAARAVPVARREEFLQNVARHLIAEPSDAAVAAAVNAQLDLTPVFLNDALPKKEKAT